MTVEQKCNEQLEKYMLGWMPKIESAFENAQVSCHFLGYIPIEKRKWEKEKIWKYYLDECEITNIILRSDTGECLLSCSNFIRQYKIWLNTRKKYLKLYEMWFRIYRFFYWLGA